MQTAEGDRGETSDNEAVCGGENDSPSEAVTAKLGFDVHCQDSAFYVSLQINSESSLFQVKERLGRSIVERGIQPSIITFFVQGRPLMLSKCSDLTARKDKNEPKNNPDKTKTSKEPTLHMTINENFYVNGDVALNKLEGLSQTVDVLVERQLEHSKVVCFDSLVDAAFTDEEISFNANRRIVLKGFSFLNREHKIEVEFEVENITTGDYTYLQAKMETEPGETVTVFCDNGIECNAGDIIFLRRSSSMASEGCLYQLRSQKDWMIGDDGCEFRFLPSKKKVVAQIFYEAIN